MLNNNILIKIFVKRMTDICYFVKKYAKQHSCEFVLICERVGKMRMDKAGLLVYNLIENERTFYMFMFSTKEKCEKQGI